MKQQKRAAALSVMVAIGLGASGCQTANKAAAGGVGDTVVAMGGIPQLGAFLPHVTTVPPTADASPIDGYWTVDAIGKRIRVERGRAYAVDGWNHALFLRVQPNMVVMTDIERTGATTYAAKDLPLMGDATFTVGADGIVSVMVGKVGYKLIPDVKTNELAGLATPAAVALAHGLDPVLTTSPDAATE